jgi:hypothetical protein
VTVLFGLPPIKMVHLTLSQGLMQPESEHEHSSRSVVEIKTRGVVPTLQH